MTVLHNRTSTLTTRNGIARPTVTNLHDTLACILYTSGTTGRPKGAMLTHGNMTWNTINATAPFGFCAGMVNLSVLPLFHIGGLNAFANPAFQYGGTSLVMRSFDPAGTLQVLADPEAGVTHFLAVPANYLFMSQDPAFEHATFPSLVTAGIGGSATPIALLETWAAKGVILQQGYGMTESAATISAQSREDGTRTIGSVGTPLLHLECRVVDPDGSTSRRAGSASCGCEGPTSRRGTGTARRRTPRRSPRTGSTPVTLSARMRTARCTSSTDGRTCTSRAARTSIRPRSRTCSTSCPTSPKPRWSASPTTAGARWARPWSC